MPIAQKPASTEISPLGSVLLFEASRAAAPGAYSRVNQTTNPIKALNNIPVTGPMLGRTSTSLMKCVGSFGAIFDRRDCGSAKERHVSAAISNTTIITSSRSSEILDNNN
jgi:hypothetical protein